MQCQTNAWPTHRALCKTLRNFKTVISGDRRLVAHAQFFREILPVLTRVIDICLPASMSTARCGWHKSCCARCALVAL